MHCVLHLLRIDGRTDALPGAGPRGSISGRWILQQTVVLIQTAQALLPAFQSGVFVLRRRREILLLQQDWWRCRFNVNLRSTLLDAWFWCSWCLVIGTSIAKRRSLVSSSLAGGREPIELSIAQRFPVIVQSCLEGAVQYISGLLRIAQCLPRHWRRLNIFRVNFYFVPADRWRTSKGRCDGMGTRVGRSNVNILGIIC